MGAGEPRGIIIVVQGEEEEAAGARYAVAPNGSRALSAAAASRREVKRPWCRSTRWRTCTWSTTATGRPARRCSASSCREGTWARTAAAGAGATAITIAMCHADTPSGLNSELRACETLKLSRSQSIAYLEQEAAGCR